MLNRCRLAWVGSCIAVVLVATGGCARDGAFEQRGSIKDTPATMPAPYTRTAKPMAKPGAPQLVQQPSPQPVERREAAPAQPATLSSQTTSAPQLASPPSQGRPAPLAQAVRRTPVSGAQLLEEGRMLFRTGEVLAARERYVAALNAPLPDVLLELARTYDSNYLDRLPKTDADADAGRARALYEQASTLGSKAAELDLARLQGGTPSR